MCLSKVADVACNFAVMFRVQGPDPKGLKMRNHAFHHHSFGKTTLSASGMLFPGLIGYGGRGNEANAKIFDSAVVLTVASVIEPFVLPQFREKLKEKPILIPGAQIDILVEVKDGVDNNMETLPWIPAKLLKMVDISQSSSAVQSLIEVSSNSLENGWEVGWTLASHSRGPQNMTDHPGAQTQWPRLRMESNNPNLMGQSTARIALLEVPSKISMNSLKLQASVPKRGDLLLAMGSPFGILSPLHFFNNISVGSIGNSYPPKAFQRSLLMADIRCLPGMEGSPVFDEHSRFIGLLTRPLRQRISGTEIQLVIPWDAIASSCSDLLLEKSCSSSVLIKSDGNLSEMEKSSLEKWHPDFPNHLSLQMDSDFPIQSAIDKATSSICLITTDDGSWASGVVLNKEGLVLTNAHLLEPWRFGKIAGKGNGNRTKTEVAMSPTIKSLCSQLENFNVQKSSHNAPTTTLETDNIYLAGEHAQSQWPSDNISQRNIHVRLDFADPWIWTDASIVYVSKGPLDVALLKLEIAPDQLRPIVMDVDCPSPGSKAYVIGHGLFGPRCDFLPSACLGVIAKVIEVKRGLQLRHDKQDSGRVFPAMLETTAPVHPGSSGGAVVNSNGCMIGLVTSNAKHGGGTVIPHLNFSIPCAALEPILKFSKDMQDVTVLQELDQANEQLSSVWALMPPLYPKPEPFLPSVPQFPLEDESKESKGSRFAKFIAERNELLRKTTKHGISRSFTYEPVHSKL